MKKQERIAREARERLVEAGGQAAQDLGFGRIMGRIVVYLYLADGERSLDEIEHDLALSKAAVSGAARQLETLGLLRRVGRPGDRKVYYRTADNLGEVFQEGLVALMRRKVSGFSAELEQTETLLRQEANGKEGDVAFLKGRVRRARQLSNRVERLLNSRVLRYLAR